MTRQTPSPVLTLEQIARRIGGRVHRAGVDSRLGANGGVYPGCTLGCRCILQANTTIGSVGFGDSPVYGRPRLIPHNDGVIIEDEVETGANCCVDRVKFGHTIIGAGTKIDNQVQIGHHVRIGRGCHHWRPGSRPWKSRWPSRRPPRANRLRGTVVTFRG